jgi:hypothetical protein
MPSGCTALFGAGRAENDSPSVANAARYSMGSFWTLCSSA